MRTPAKVTHVGTGQPVSAIFPFALDGVDLSSDVPRIKLATWLTAPENPYFAKSLTNRYWSYLNGKGIIDPVDDIRLSNPPTNPQLLDALTSDFIAHNFDLKHLLRTITNSHTYQRTFVTTKCNEDDDANYSHATPRRLAQTLTLINGPTISDAIVHPQGLIAKLTAAKAEPKQIVEEIYLSVFNRLPTDAEQQQGTQYVTANGSTDGAQDLMWALINSPAFLFNR